MGTILLHERAPRGGRAGEVRADKVDDLAGGVVVNVKVARVDLYLGGAGANPQPCHAPHSPPELI